MRVAVTVLAVLAVSICWAAGDITLVADGETVPCDPPPMMHEGHVYVPLRAAAEALGWDVHYDAQSKRVTICKADICTLVRQSDGITRDGHLLVGIRRVGEALMVTVDWDARTRTVRITSGD